MSAQERARGIIAAILAEEAAADRARFRDTEATQRVCLTEAELGPGSYTGDGWCLFVLNAATLCCGSCPACVENQWREAMKADD